jgi:endonuclease/exonuclease/phosphatase family metal-dependent hydrolase
MKILTLNTIAVTNAKNADFKTRDILWLKARLSSGDTVHFFSNHWPSRREGEAESRPNRILAAKALRKAIDGIYKENPNANIAISGDFNDMPNDLTISLYLGADADGSGNGKLVNPFLPLYEAGDGSYKYKNEWNMLDQIIVSNPLNNTQNKLSYLPGSAKVFRAPFMEDKNPKYLGNPFRTYAGKNYLGGYSDHFPVLLKLQSK